MYRIMIIEDEADISRVMELNLAAEGYEVSCSASGTEGLELVRSELPDLLLLDLMLPGMNGLDVCRQLKSDAATRNIPVIMVTAKGEENDIVLGLGLGAEDYITKPFRVSKLIARRHGGHVAVASTPGSGSTFTVTLPLYRNNEPHPTRHD